MARRVTTQVVQALLFGGVLFSQEAQPKSDFANEHAYPVSRIVDGDTVEILIDGLPAKVRLIGVDTPETVHPNKPVEYYGREANTFTRNLLQGESVYLDYGQERTDRFGRLLAYLYRAPDGFFVNLEIVRQGYGRIDSRYPFTYMEMFRVHEKAARESGKGLWGATLPQTSVVSQPHPSVEEPVLPPSEGIVTVYVTASGSKYHRGECRYLSKSKIATSLHEAQAKYISCSVCRPDEPVVGLEPNGSTRRPSTESAR